MFILSLLFVPLLTLAVEHCCQEKKVGGVTYKLKETAKNDLHLQYNCLNNCVYNAENSNKDVCFAAGALPVKCLEASVHFTSFKSEAMTTMDATEKIVSEKLEEYGNLKFNTAKDKIDWIKQDLETLTGKTWEEIKAHHNKYTNVSPSTRRKLIRIEDKIRQHAQKILKIYQLAEDHDEVQNGLNAMEEDVLHFSHSDHELHQATHNGIHAARLGIKLLTKDEKGMTIIDKMQIAIVNNTADAGNLKKLRITGNDCAAEVVGGAFAGGAAGCIAGATAGLATGGALSLPACGVGAAAGFIGGFIGGGIICGFTAAFSACLATTSHIETIEGPKQVSELQLGDFVKTSLDGHHTHFTEFLGWMDRHQSQPAYMLNIWTSNGQYPLTLSESHVVFTSNTTKYAGDIQPGDCLLHWNGTAMEEMDVETISPTISNGYWAPLTKAGHLLVDGYLTSCYASYPHKLADIAMAPIKSMSLALLDDHESQHKDGVRKVISLIKEMGKFIGARKPDDISKKIPVNNFGIVNSFGMKSEF